MFRKASRYSSGSIHPIATSTTEVIGEYEADCRGLPAKMDTLRRPQIRLPDPTARAPGPESRQEEDPPMAIHLIIGPNCNSNQPPQQPPGRTPPQQSGGAGKCSGHPGAPSRHQPLPHAHRPLEPRTPSRKSLPQLKLPSNYKSRSILDMQQMLEDWYNKSTFSREEVLKDTGLIKFWKLSSAFFLVSP